MNNKIIYGIIILCIVCIILVSVLSTGHKVLDIILVVISGIGILAGGYLIRKNKKTARVAPDSPYSGSADDKDLDPEIYKKIATDRYIAIKKDFYNTFVNYFKGPTDENNKESEKYVLGQIQNKENFKRSTENYLNNNLSIEEYYKEILPLFDYTKINEYDIIKTIIKYVVFFYLPQYNKVGVEIPPNYKKLVDLYIKNKIKNEVDSILQEQRNLYTRSVSTNLQALTPFAQNQLNIMYNDFGTQYEKDVLIAYIEELLKDVKEEDVKKKKSIITKITTLSSDYFMRN